MNDAVEFIIDETFQVAGVGVVVAGTVKRGTLMQGASLLLGPHAGDASFKLTAIKSIAYKRLPVTTVLFACLLVCSCLLMCYSALVSYSSNQSVSFYAQVIAGQTAALALKRVKRSSLRKVNLLAQDIMLYCFHCHPLSSISCQADFSCAFYRVWCWWIRPYIQRHPGNLMLTLPFSRTAQPLLPSKSLAAFDMRTS